VRQQVGNNKVICALSGGVDSSVLSQLLHNAIGKKLYCVFVLNPQLLVLVLLLVQLIVFFRQLKS